MKKVYVSKTGGSITFYVKVKEEAKLVSLNSFDLTFKTEDAEIQKGIEASKFFKEGKIKLLRSEGADVKTPKSDKTPSVITEFPDVKDVNGAIEVLTGKPYNVAKGSLKTPEAVKERATEKGISFPNLNL
jgi:hypothetical protein